MVDISIIALSSKTEKGRALEQQFGYILDKLGFTDLRFNIHRTGEEIDVKGFGRLFNEPLLAECKAHKKEISTKDLKKFFATFQTSLDRNPNTRGIFLSLSGYNSTALEWYDENITNEKQRIFKKLNGKDFIRILNEQGILCSLDKLDSIITSLTSLPIIEYQILLTDRGIFWKIIVFAKNSNSKYIIFLKSNGDNVLPNDINYILERLSIEDAIILRIVDRHKVISCLYDLNERTIEEIYQQIQEPKEDIQIIIDELLAEKIILIQNDKIKLRQEFPSFYLVFKESKEHQIQELVKLMLSKYYDNLLDESIDHTEARFKLELINHKKSIKKILKVSPKCLEFCLEGDTTQFKNLYNQVIKGKQVTEDVKSEYNKSQFRSFFSQIISLLFTDCVFEPILNQLRIQEHINTIYALIKLKLGSERGLQLDIETEYPILSLKLKKGKSIKSGEWVVASDIETFIEIGNRFSGIEEYDKAIHEYEQVIDKGKNPKSIVKAKINKAIDLRLKNNYHEAKEIIQELEKPEIYEIIKNNEELHNAYKINKKKIENHLKNDN